MKRAFVLLALCSFAATTTTFAGCSSDSSDARSAPDTSDASDTPDGTASRPTTSPAVVGCTASADGGFSCNCTASGSTGAVVDGGNSVPFTMGADCETTTLGATPLLCCADPAYPASGSCGCSESADGRRYVCAPVDTGSCQCTYAPAAVEDDDAGCAARTYGDGGTCCAYRGSDFDESECSCYSAAEGVTCGAPGSGSRVVSDCTSAAAAGLQVVPDACPAGRHQVTGCATSTPP